MNPRRILVIFARLIAFVAIAQALSIWIFCRSSWTPIERHYLSAYFWSSLPVAGPSTVEVRLIWKTGRHRKQQLATDDDVVDSAAGTSTVLSQPARDAGWKAVIESPPQQLPADILSQDLSSLAFGGQSLWDLLLLPELSAIAALCAVLSAWYLLIGFFRTLPSEFAWRRQYSAFEEWYACLFEDCAALGQSLHSRFKTLQRRATRRIETHSAAPCTKITVIAPEAKQASFPIPLFGIYIGTGDGYLWTERDAIE